MNLLACDDRFSEICSTFIRTSYILTIHRFWFFSPCFNATLAHCINQTNATSGFDPIAIFQISLKWNQWSKSSDNLKNSYWPPHIYHAWKLEQTTKKDGKQFVSKKYSDYFSKGYMMQFNVIEEYVWISSNYYNDVTVSAMASQIISLTSAYSIVYSGADQIKKIQALRHWPLCEEITAHRWIPHIKDQ